MSENQTESDVLARCRCRCHTDGKVAHAAPCCYDDRHVIPPAGTEADHG